MIDPASCLNSILLPFINKGLLLLFLRNDQALANRLFVRLLDRLSSYSLKCKYKCFGTLRADQAGGN